MKRYRTPFFTAVLLAASTAAFAQTAGDSLADRIARFQALGSEGPAFKPAPPQADPDKRATVHFSFWDYQALAADGPAFHQGIVGTGTMFADKHGPGTPTRQAATASPTRSAN